VRWVAFPGIGLRTGRVQVRKIVLGGLGASTSQKPNSANLGFELLLTLVGFGVVIVPVGCSEAFSRLLATLARPIDHMLCLRIVSISSHPIVPCFVSDNPQINKYTDRSDYQERYSTKVRSIIKSRLFVTATTGQHLNQFADDGSSLSLRW
jgi:hypothetical protein